MSGPVDPHDDGLRLADPSALQDLPAGVDAVVSLCRVQYEGLPTPSMLERPTSESPRMQPQLWFLCLDAVRGDDLIASITCGSRTSPS
jgi:hypothetical protein